MKRLALKTGKVEWSHGCDALGVGHSEYLHDVYLELRDDKLVVVSQASGGWWIEVLATVDGKRLHRWHE
ncbi:MAG: hypothetical protein R3E76_10480 [Planctomycetota bacterium]